MFLIAVVLAMFPPYLKVFLVGHTGNHLWALYSLHSTPSTLFTGHYKCGFTRIVAPAEKEAGTAATATKQEARNTDMEQLTTYS
ncbi:hypothetical protein Tco_0295924 [Tanacetum coccineum]